MYAPMYMRRKQLYLDDETDRRLKRLAAHTGLSEASHVREALRAYLGGRRGWPAEGDQLERIVGLVSEPQGPDDVAENHDHYLSGAPKDPS